MKKHFKLAALLLAMLLVVSSAFAEINPTIDSAAYENAVSTAEADSSVSYNWLYESMITFLSGKTREERLAYLNGTESWGQIGHFVVGELQAYYAAKYPEGDLICTCAALCGFGDALHASKCPWYPEQLPTEEQTAVATAEDGTQISVAGELPVDVELSVETATLADVAALAPELEGMTNDHKVFDISLLQPNAEEWQPDGEPVAVTMDVADLGNDGDPMLVYHVHENEDGTVTSEIMGPFDSKHGQITFAMNRFSYVLVLNASMYISNVEVFYPVQTYVDNRQFPIAGNKYWAIIGVYIDSDRSTHVLIGQVGNGKLQTSKIETVEVDEISYPNNGSLLEYYQGTITELKLGESRETAEDVVNFEGTYGTQNGSTVSTNQLNGLVDINLGKDAGIGEQFSLALNATTGTDDNSFNIGGIQVELHLEYGINKTIYKINENTFAAESDQETVNAGDWVYFKLVVNNSANSNTNIAGATLTDELPACFDPMTLQWSTDNQNWSTTIPTVNELEPTEKQTFYVKAQVTHSFKVEEDTTFTNYAYLRVPDMATAMDTADVLIEAPKTGTLTITKVVNDSTFTEGVRTFTFEVKNAAGESEGIKTITVNATNKANASANTATFEDLLAGQYTVTETDTAGYTTTYNGETTESGNVTVPAGGNATMDVVNTASVKQDVTVTKNWVDNSDKLGYRPESITVSLEANGSAVNDQPTWTKNGDTWTAVWTNLDKFDANGNEIDYAVTETAVPNYNAPAISGLTITNSIAVGDLEISKTVPAVSGDVDTPDANQLFTFMVVLTDAGNNAVAGEFDYTGSKTGKIQSGGTITLAAGEKITIQKLPAGTKYIVTETPVDYYTPTKTELEGTISAGSVSSAAFENTYTKLQTGTLTITKTVKDVTFTSGTKTFNFTLKLNSDSNVAKKQFEEWAVARTYRYDETNVSAAVSIEVASTDTGLTKSLELEDLPIGNYTVTETAVQGYNTTYAPAGGNVTVTNSETAATVIVTNTITATRDITVEKVWQDSSNKYQTRPETISLELLGNNVTVTSEVQDFTNPATVTGNSDTWTYTWKDVPTFDENGAYIVYTVKEVAVAEYTVTNTESIVDGTKDTLTITNTVQRAQLKITKTGLNEKIYPSGDRESALFTVEAVDKTKDRRVWNVAINGNGTVTIDGVKIGVEYTVTENNDWTWRYEDQGAQKVTIVAGENPVSFSNVHSNDQWLGGDNYKVNIFGKPAATND